MFQTGGFPDLDLSFLVVLFGTFPIFSGFPRFARGWSGDFPDWSFPLSRPINRSYEEQSRKGPRHNLDLSRKSGKPPSLEPPRSFSQNSLRYLICGQKTLVIRMAMRDLVHSGHLSTNEENGIWLRNLHPNNQ